MKSGIPSSLECNVILSLFYGGTSLPTQIRATARDLGASIPRGSIYVTLKRLEAEGVVSSWTEDPEEGDGVGLTRRLYTLTAYGKRLGQWILERPRKT